MAPVVGVQITGTASTTLNERGPGLQTNVPTTCKPRGELSDSEQCCGD